MATARSLKAQKPWPRSPVPEERLEAAGTLQTLEVVVVVHQAQLVERRRPRTVDPAAEQQPLVPQEAADPHRPPGIVQAAGDLEAIAGRDDELRPRRVEQGLRAAHGAVQEGGGGAHRSTATLSAAARWPRAA
jgi:hypothetical protein